MPDADGRRNLQDVSLEMNIFDGVRDQGGDPVQPTRLTSGDDFRFKCHSGLECWNRCCHGADIVVTPLDALVLGKHLGLSYADFLAQHAVPGMWDQAMLPVPKLRMGGEDGRGPCPFMREDGCAVYEARPVTCRYYPLGLASFKMKDADRIEDFYFLVRENHCKGHDEAREISVGDFREEQGVEDYDRVNRGWMDILLKMASWQALGGPWGQEPEPRTKQMFYLVSTDPERFRRFVFETKFLESYEVSDEAVELLKTDDEAMLLLGFDWMKSVLFNEPTILLKEHVLHDAIARAREDMGAT